ncbi:MAG: hypothetical protein KDE27_31330 [Planctomycetes bacterium]|nr:hypothetical protein [Planctomycetota bacterium]
MARRPLRFAVLLGGLLAGGCAPLVRYTNDLVDSTSGRTWFTRVPAGIGGTFGFVVGVPIDIVASPVSWAVYRSQPKETRDVMSVFLFPSFLLWQVGTLVGSPFDLVEWAVWRSWNERAITPEEREAIERAWDEQEYSEYPVEPVYPPTATSG